MILAGLGIILIILGFINAIADATPGGGIMFWILGGIVIIPGSIGFMMAFLMKYGMFGTFLKETIESITEITNGGLKSSGIRFFEPR